MRSSGGFSADKQLTRADLRAASGLRLMLALATLDKPNLLILGSRPIISTRRARRAAFALNDFGAVLTAMTAA